MWLKMNSKFNAEDFILLLLNLDNKKEIKGDLFLQKEMFLIVKEVFPNLDKELNFKPYYYGPYSGKLTELLNHLANNSLIKIDDIEGSNCYTITDKGIDKLNKIEFPGDIKNKVFKLKKGSNVLGYKGLLRYVYFNYPKYTTKSKIKDEVLGE